MAVPQHDDDLIERRRRFAIVWIAAKSVAAHTVSTPLSQVTASS